MYYLAGQIIFMICLAVVVGVCLGWWSRSLWEGPESSARPDDVLNPFSARTRLEHCHRDNAALRRELQQAQEQLEQLTRAQALSKNKGMAADLAAQLQASEARVQALLDDLQLREDTVAVLEAELKQLRGQV